MGQHEIRLQSGRRHRQPGRPFYRSLSWRPRDSTAMALSAKCSVAGSPGAFGLGLLVSTVSSSQMPSNIFPHVHYFCPMPRSTHGSNCILYTLVVWSWADDQHLLPTGLPQQTLEERIWSCLVIPSTSIPCPVEIETTWSSTQQSPYLPHPRGPAQIPFPVPGD